MKWLASFILIGALSACTVQDRKDSAVESAPAKSSPRIFGGIDVSKGSWRAASSVMITGETAKNAPFICTGTFIADDLILTAAHCVGDDLELMNLIFDVSPFTAEAELVTREVTRAWVYKDALTDPKQRDDVAILGFSGGLPPGARIARLAEAGKIVGPNLDFQALGYGRTTGLSPEDTDLHGAGVLRLVSLESADMTDAKPDFTVWQNLGRGVCYGDSGGAAYSVLTEDDAVVVGIASGVFNPKGDSTVSQDDCKMKSIYMNVIYYRKWISSIIEESRIVPDGPVTGPGAPSTSPPESSSTLSKPSPSDP